MVYRLDTLYQAFKNLPFLFHSIQNIQDVNISKLCKSFIETVLEAAPNLAEEARGVKATFEKLFSLFATCHMVYDSKMEMSSDILVQLGTYLD